MEYRALGRTGLQVSAIAFGAGPVPALLTAGGDEIQTATVRRAIARGINWFDTAATYGDGKSEQNLGAALEKLRADGKVHVATKVRIMPDKLHDIANSVRESFLSSLDRLRLKKVTLLQLHNSVTPRAGDEPTSVTLEHVLGDGGILSAMQDLKREGLVEHLGLTAIGNPTSLKAVLDSGHFATIQVPYNLLNPSAGRDVRPEFDEADYGNIIGHCVKRGVGALAIRVFAGGAVAGNAPSAHTHSTKFFPLDLYQRDCQRCEDLRAVLPGYDLREVAVRFALDHPGVASAIIGFASPEQVDDGVAYAAAGPLDQAARETIEQSLRTNTS